MLESLTKPIKTTQFLEITTDVSKAFRDRGYWFGYTVNLYVKHKNVLFQLFLTDIFNQHSNLVEFQKEDYDQQKQEFDNHLKSVYTLQFCEENREYIEHKCEYIINYDFVEEHPGGDYFTINYLEKEINRLEHLKTLLL